MKSVYLGFALALAIPVQGLARDLEKEFRKTIELYDVPTQVRDLDDHTASTFWEGLVKNDMSFRKFSLAMEKPKGAEKAALRKVEMLPRFDARYVDWVDGAEQEYCDSVSRVLGLFQETPDFRLYIADVDQPYSCSALGNDAFSVIIDKGLLNCAGFTDRMLWGIVAHEYAHGLLRHRLHNEYNIVRKERKRNLVNGLTLGVIGTAAVAAIAAIPGDGDRHADYEDNSITIINKTPDQKFIKEVTPYNYVFAKDQILQADLIAFRFLEHLGYDGDEYINLLRLLENNTGIPQVDDEYTIEKDSKDYPTLRYRIRLLEYASSHPELVNKENEKIYKSLVEKSINRRQAKVKAGKV